MTTFAPAVVRLERHHGRRPPDRLPCGVHVAAVIDPQPSTRNVSNPPSAAEEGSPQA